MKRSTAFGAMAAHVVDCGPCPSADATLETSLRPELNVPLGRSPLHTLCVPQLPALAMMPSYANNCCGYILPIAPCMLFRPITPVGNFNH